jgi:hypothetical protein
MPFRSEFRSIEKLCLWYNKKLELHNNRDIERKKFCSHACRQLWRYSNGEWTMEKIIKASMTPEANKKKVNKGEKNGRYLGDRKLVKRPMCTTEGKLWRLAVYQKDNYTCQKCGQCGGKLEAHHIKGYFECPELRFDINNGITLCKECHKKTDSYGWKSINIRKSESNYVTI